MKQCPYYKKCGGCAYGLDQYQYSLKSKQSMIKSLFGHTKPIIGMDDPYGYRHKVTVSFKQNKNGLTSGIYAADSHRIIDVDDCPLHHPLANSIIKTVVKTANDFGYTAFDEDRGIGLLRHLQLRVSMDDHVLMTLVVSTTKIPGSRKFFEIIRNNHPQIVSIVLNVNNRHTSMVLGNQSRVVYGKGMVIDTMDGLNFRISSQSFYQVNPLQVMVCYKLALDALKLKESDTLVDAYCGTGTISLLAAKRVKQVIGIEVNRYAIVDALANKRDNKIDNIVFKVGSVDRYLDVLDCDAVVVDPPRSGCSKVFLDAIIRNKIQRIGYISCNPQTQKRDTDYLKRHGYTIEFIQPVDMFPFSEHCECVVKLQLKNK